MFAHDYVLTTVVTISQMFHIYTSALALWNYMD